MPVPPAPDVRPDWQVASGRSWAWFRGLPTGMQVVAWVVGFWILPAWWVLSRARGPVGVISAGVLALLGTTVVAAAAAGDGSSTPEPAVVARADESEPAAPASPSPSVAATPSPTPAESAAPSPSPVPSPTPSEAPATPSPPAPTPSAVPEPTPAASPSPESTSTPEAKPAPEPERTPKAKSNRGKPGRRTTVERIVDGDTIYLAALPERARLIGIDTPETVKPGSPVECFGPEASRALERLVPPGTKVRIVHDVERTDRYDRPLVYLYRASDDLFVNKAMVRRGYAQVSTYPPNVAHVDEFRRAQRRAREAGAGLWSADCDDASAADEPEQSGAAGGSSGSGGGSSSGGSGSGGGAVVIADIEWDGPGDDVEYDDSEYVLLRNTSSRTVDVDGWSLTDLVGHEIVIPDGYSIPPDATLRIHTGPGDDGDRAHHHGAGQAIWNNSGGDTATLRDASGTVVHEFTYSS